MKPLTPEDWNAAVLAEVVRTPGVRYGALLPWVASRLGISQKMAWRAVDRALQRLHKRRAIKRRGRLWYPIA